MTNDDSTKRARQEYYRARVHNVRTQVPMVKVLDLLGVDVYVTEDIEIQYPCPLHGDGQDQGFSARVYPEEEGDPGGHTYCWGCHQHRDQIQWVRDYLGLSFIQALKYLEEAFDVTGIPSIYDYFDPNRVPEGESKPRLVNEIEAILDNEDSSPHTKLDVLERKIDRLVKSNPNLPLKTVTSLYYIYDSLRFDIKEGNLSEDKIAHISKNLYDKISSLSD